MTTDPIDLDAIVEELRAVAETDDLHGFVKLVRRALPALLEERERLKLEVERCDLEIDSRSRLEQRLHGRILTLEQQLAEAKSVNDSLTEKLADIIRRLAAAGSES